MKDPMRVMTLLARFGTAKYGSAVQDICAIFAQQMPEVTHEMVVIDNSLLPDHEETIGPRITLIGGNNSAWEFSAWDRGVEYLGPKLDDYDFVHFATSAFRQLYVRYLARFNARMLDLIRSRAAAVGHIDFYNDPVTLFGRAGQSWLRSSFVFLPPAEIRLLGPLVSVEDRASLFSGDPAAPFLPGAPLSAGYRENILGWLTGEGTGQGTEWHSRFVLSEQTLRFFEDKTVAILNEHMLTSRLRSQGCSIVDATWLATCAGKDRVEPMKSIPDWRVQVTSRDVDAAAISVLPGKISREAGGCNLLRHLKDASE
jgi:hypothetical protein